MPDRLTSKFYLAEADRLLELLFVAQEPAQRLLLLETAARFRQMAAHIKARSQTGAAANTNSARDSKQA